MVFDNSPSLLPSRCPCASNYAAGGLDPRKAEKGGLPRWPHAMSPLVSISLHLQSWMVWYPPSPTDTETQAISAFVIAWCVEFV